MKVLIMTFGTRGDVQPFIALAREPRICPFGADQPFWGRRRHVLGVAPPPVPQRGLTPDRLAAALDRAMTDPAIRATAAELGHRIRGEDGAAAAAARLESLVLDGSPCG